MTFYDLVSGVVGVPADAAASDAVVLVVVVVAAVLVVVVVDFVLSFFRRMFGGFV